MLLARSLCGAFSSLWLQRHVGLLAAAQEGRFSPRHMSLFKEDLDLLRGS
jgi:hypothetical protein